MITNQLSQQIKQKKRTKQQQQHVEEITLNK